jgi:hypothetical protein
MANEISVNLSLKVTNGNLTETIATGTKLFDQTAVGGPTPGYVNVGTTEETIAFGELSTQGYLFLQNLDVTNYVRWGFGTGAYGGRLEPGEFAMFRLNPGTTLYLIANTAACKVTVKAFED